MADRIFSGFAFMKLDLGLYLQHNPEVPDDLIWVPKYVGPDKVKFIGRTKTKRSRKGPLSVSLFAYPDGTCFEQRHLIRHYQERIFAPVAFGDALMVNDPELSDIVRPFQSKGCFDELGIRIDTPPATKAYLQTRIGFIIAPPSYCHVHSERREDITDPLIILDADGG